MRIKIIYIIIALMILPMVTAEVQTLGTYKKGSLVNLIQSCDNSTYSNITRLIYPNSSFAINSQTTMTKSGDNYNYTFSNNNDLGEYLVYGICDENGIQTSWSYNYFITTTGKKVSLSNIIIVIVFLFASGVLFLLGYSFDKNKWLLKSFFFLCSLLSILLAINSSSIIASESLELYNMGEMGFILFIPIILLFLLYIFIMWTVQTFRILKQKEQLRWEY